MFCSTIVPTIGRPELSRAVQSVLKQKFTADDFEVIVVNDSIQPLPQASWQKSERVRIINTNQRERCIARNTGAAIARGKYLHFLDDDDWLLPDALQNFWLLAQNSNAAWLYGGARLIDLIGKQEITLHLGLNGNCFVQMMAGEWIPTGAYLVNPESFFAVGGFNYLITQGEDKEMCQRIALRDDFACTSATVVAISRGGVSTSDNLLGLIAGRREREKILNETGAFTRMRTSANSAYWRGRIVRIYLASVIWNMQERRILTVVKRTALGLMGFILAGQHIFNRDCWRAMIRSHTSRIVEC
jgi:glycosyltransferase involved in cell wall biosynthesis